MQDPRGTPFPCALAAVTSLQIDPHRIGGPLLHAPMDHPAQEGCGRATVHSCCARRTSRTVFIVTILCRGEFGHLALAAKA